MTKHEARNVPRGLFAVNPRVLSCVVLVLASAPHLRAIADEQQRMVRIPAHRVTVGTSEAERAEIAKRFDCHPTWLGDDLAAARCRPPGVLDRPASGHQRAVPGLRGSDRASAARVVEPVGRGVPCRVRRSSRGGRQRAGRRRLCQMGRQTPTHRGRVGGGDGWPETLALRLGRPVAGPPGATTPGPGLLGAAGHAADRQRPLRPEQCSGAEDFAGQVLEWVSNVRPHHGVQFQLLKGASWFHEDPVNFRTASGWYAHEGWRSAFTGFRCALDGEKTPPRVTRAPSGQVDLHPGRHRGAWQGRSRQRPGVLGRGRHFPAPVDSLCQVRPREREPLGPGDHYLERRGRDDLAEDPRT